MTSFQIAARILGRILIFGFGGAAACALIGALEGGAFGALLGTLAELTIPSASSAHGFVQKISEFLTTGILGAVFGAAFGVIAGGISGALSFAILGGLQRAQSDLNAAFRSAFRGAFWCALLGAAGAAFSGAVLFPLMQMLQSNSHSGPTPTLLQAAFQPIGGGFFCGSIAGFVLGCFGGALHGGLTLKPITPRGLMRRLRSSREESKRPDAEPQSV